MTPSNRFRSDGKTTCTRCGKGTYSTKGVCRECHNGAALPDPTRMSTAALVAYRDHIEAELRRRVEELQAALSHRAALVAPVPASVARDVSRAVPGDGGEQEAA